MKKKITIVDYGAGNILSLKRALEHLSLDVDVTIDTNKIVNASYLILPGDGAFGYAIKQLKARNMQKFLRLVGVK